jgi:hypothetical protein
MGRARRIKVKGVRKTEGEDVEMLSLVLWLQAKRVLRERRQTDAKAREKAKRRESEGERER